MMTDGKHEGTPPGEDGEGDEALWRLLERAPRPRPVSPYFARRVLREVTALENTARPEAAGGPLGWLARGWQAWRRQPRAVFTGAAAAVALTLAGGAGLTSSHWHAPAAPVLVPSHVDTTAQAGLDVDVFNSPDEPEDTLSLAQSVATVSEPVVSAQDVEVIADLDNILSREESRLWTEEDTARF